MKTALDNQENHSSRDSSVPPRASKKNILIGMWGGVGVAVVVILAAALFVFQSKQVTVSSPAASMAPATESVLVEFEKLKGKWLRPDGGYVLELKRLLPQNELEAAYFNPNPIHVGKAKLYKERGFVKVFVELQDVNYPGSTYTLIYDVEHDQLCGVYYQATQRQEFEIVFERMEKGH